MEQLFPGVLANGLLFLGLLLLTKSSIGKHRVVRLLMALLFVYVNTRYIAWRFDQTLPTFSFTLETTWMWLFFFTEAAAALVLNWHFIVMVAPTNRSAEADHWEKLLRNQSQQESVDVFIPTLNESIEILAHTIASAQVLDYPNFRVWVLDDGSRDWLKQYADEQGVGYLSRTERTGFKAGNLNNALSHTNGEVICVIDADFELDSNFLWRTVGMLHEPEVGLVQTPQVFSNSDAVQHNLGGSAAWTESQCTFSDVIQSGRDRWDNAFCYGTSFVVKREALDEIGGFAEESITEDLLTSYALLGAGYKTRFLNEKLSVGLATQDIGAYVIQRCRWCIGTLQCLFVSKGVLRSRSLSIIDRLFFLDPILYHIGTLWTMLLLLAPALYWWTGIAPFFSDFGHFLVVFAPRMLLVSYGFYWLSDKKTIPLVSEVGRIVGIFQLTKSILSALTNPFKQEFKITIKSQSSDQRRVYWDILLPLAGLALITLLGFLARYTSVLSNEILWRTDFGLMISLSVYVLWLIYLACLTCVQRPHDMESEVVYHGSVRKTIRVLFRRIF
jgi:cellulose synthase (UDP-forming)